MVNDTEKLDIFAAMAYYASVKKYAIRRMLQIRKPLSSEDLCLINILYGAYFTYLIGLIDFLKEHHLLEIKQVKNILGNENNYYYVRNLRNAIVHRGEEIANKGVEIANKPGVIVPISPISVFDPHKKRNYNKFTDNLLQTVIKCELLNALFLDIIIANDLTNYPDETEESFKQKHENDPYLPSYAKTPEMMQSSWEGYCAVVKDIHQHNVKSKLLFFHTEELFV